MRSARSRTTRTRAPAFLEVTDDGLEATHKAHALQPAGRHRRHRQRRPGLSRRRPGQGAHVRQGAVRRQHPLVQRQRADRLMVDIRLVQIEPLPAVRRPVRLALARRRHASTSARRSPPPSSSRSAPTAWPSGRTASRSRTVPIAPAGGAISTPKRFGAAGLSARRLWLLRREAIHDPGYQRGATVTRIDRYIREALQPFVDRRIASTFDVNVERVGRERIEARVVIYRGPTLAVEMRYQVIWDAMLLEAE